MRNASFGEGYTEMVDRCESGGSGDECRRLTKIKKNEEEGKERKKKEKSKEKR